MFEGARVSESADTAYLVPPGWVRSVYTGRLRSVRALFYEDGTVRIEHECRTVDGVRLIVAPALQLGTGHIIEQANPLTVSPSILCPDCGLHGFIREDRWVDA